MPTNKPYFIYGNDEINHLKEKDPRLAEVIDKLGKLDREVRPDLFTALMRTIVGQQISTKAQATIWQRMQDRLPEITPQVIADYDADELQQLGASHRKVSYMQDTAHKIISGELDLQALHNLTDAEVIEKLCKLRGIGQWSAEMLMIFSMQRGNILSFGDLAIVRGLRMLYRHREITTKLFAKYQRRYAPYASVASLYLWAVAGGAIPELQDLQTANKAKLAKKSVKKSAKQPKKVNHKQANNTAESTMKKHISQINKAFYNSPVGQLEIHATDNYISYLQFANTDVEQEINKESKPNELTDTAIRQLGEYFAGNRHQFDLPIKQQGTDFQQQVWQALCDIDYATTASYKQVAEAVGNAKASRAVGMANNKNKIAIIVPCHRVIGSNGKLVGYAGGLDIKQKLLDIEKQGTL